MLSIDRVLYGPGNGRNNKTSFELRRSQSVACLLDPNFSKEREMKSKKIFKNINKDQSHTFGSL